MLVYRRVVKLCFLFFQKNLLVDVQQHSFLFSSGEKMTSLPVDFVVCPFPHAGCIKDFQLLECLERWMFLSPSGGIKHCRIATDKSEAQSVLNRASPKKIYVDVMLQGFSLQKDYP